ncbi:MAG TPA: S46 family peptidase [Bryobacteraceae bacterium]|nr:S46 family peptidase [Bryobacteraceae bacterium]
MHLRFVARAAFLAALLPAALPADEGLWLFNQFPKDVVKQKYGFEVSDAFLENLRLSTLHIGNASGAFVSSRGLIVTSRRAVAECAAKAAPQAAASFAAAESGEFQCPNLTADVLVALNEVTRQVKEGVTDKMKATDALEKRNASISRIEKACAQKSGNVCTVVKLASGERYDLYQYKRYSDLRLVFTPEFSIANFGGAAAEITYPRYSMDIAFLRAYINGQPAATPHHFKWSDEAIQENDLLFAPGSPIATSRLATSEQLDFYSKTSLPYAVSRLATRIEDLRVAAPKSAALASLGAQYKLTAGKLIGLKDEWLLVRKSNFQRKLRNAVEKDPKLGAEAGKVWDQVATAYKNWTPDERRYQLLENPAAEGSVLFRMARASLRNQPPPPPAPIEEAAEIALLSRYLKELQNLGEKEVNLKSVLGGKTPDVAAAEMVHAAKPGDASALTPLVKAVEDGARKIGKRHAETIEALEVSAAEKIAQYRFRLFGAADYPDATNTPRLTFGAPKPYRDRTEAPVPFATTFGGLLHYAAAVDPVALPTAWAAVKSSLGLTTPMNFVSTCDITSGPSGAPVINQKGELAGVTFDANLESIAVTYLYDEDKARAVHVSSQGITEALQKVYKASALLRELETSGGARP